MKKHLIEEIYLELNWFSLPLSRGQYMGFLNLTFLLSWLQLVELQVFGLVLASYKYHKVSQLSWTLGYKIWFGNLIREINNSMYQIFWQKESAFCIVQTLLSGNVWLFNKCQMYINSCGQRTHQTGNPQFWWSEFFIDIIISSQGSFTFV